MRCSSLKWAAVALKPVKNTPLRCWILCYTQFDSLKDSIQLNDGISFPYYNKCEYLYMAEDIFEGNKG